MLAQVMGVLNVTPDSFSDGGRWFDHRAAIAHGLDMAAQGADVVDVGGESTRPGARPVDEMEECRRVVPVVEALARRVRVSVDTSKPGVAKAAVAAGAARAAGVAEVWIDPGIGFGKTPAHNLALLRHLRVLVDTGFPVLVGASRKTFLGRVAAGPAEPPLDVGDRREASLAAATVALANGAAMVRAHDVAPTVQAARIVGQPVAPAARGAGR